MKHKFIRKTIAFCLAAMLAFPQTVAAQDISVTSQETTDGIRVIRGFVPLSATEKERVFEGRPTREEILSTLPAEISVYLDADSAPQQIPVTWEPRGNEYEGTAFFYYEFLPVIDGTQYRVMRSITELPPIAVYLKPQHVLTDDTTGAVLSNQQDGATYRPENIEKILDYLTGTMGLNTAAACGVLANIYAESAFDPEAVNDSSGAYGICQWLGSRKTNLINFAGAKYNKLNKQLAFLQYELEQCPQDSQDTLQQLQAVKDNANGAARAGHIFCDVFERPGNQATSDARASRAKEYYATYGGTTLTGDTHKLVKGGTLKLKQEVTEFTPGGWSSSNTGVATVDSNGKVKAVGTGSCTITATSSGSVKDRINFKIKVEKITLSGAKTKRTGESFSLADMLPEDLEDRGLTVIGYSSSDEKIFSVDEDGTVTPGKKNGSAKLKIKFESSTEDGWNYSAGTLSTTFNLKRPDIAAKSVKIKAGKKAQIEITNYKSSIDMSFEAEDPSVAEVTVNSKGKVYIKAVGEKGATTKVYLTVEGDDEPTDSIKVTVK